MSPSGHCLLQWDAGTCHCLSGSRSPSHRLTCQLTVQAAARHHAIMHLPAQHGSAPVSTAFILSAAGHLRAEELAHLTGGPTRPASSVHLLCLGLSPPSLGCTVPLCSLCQVDGSELYWWMGPPLPDTFFMAAFQPSATQVLHSKWMP